MLLFEKFLTFVSGEKFANYINSSQHLIYMIFRAISLFCNGRIARKFMRDMVVFWKPRNMVYLNQQKKKSVEDSKSGKMRIQLHTCDLWVDPRILVLGIAN